MILRLLMVGIGVGHIAGFTSQAQVDTTFMLSPAIVQVRAEQSYQNLDSFDLWAKTKTLSGMLSEYSSVQTRSYGANALASLSLRGGTAEQSTVYWNGISLQSIANGVTDLSLLPMALFDRLEFNSFQSVSRGSGSISGSLNLVNGTVHGDSSKTVWMTTGSFGSYSGGTSLGYRTKSVWHQTRLAISSNQNSYPYRSVSYPIDERIDTLQNARATQLAMLHQLTATFKRLRPLHVRLWLQKNEREIPPTMLESESRKYQTDASMRIQSTWSVRILNGELKVSAAWSGEDLEYGDYDTFFYRSEQSSVLLHYVKKLGKYHQMGIDLEGRRFMVDADTFYNETRNEISGAMHHRWKRKKITLNSGLRLAGYSTFKRSPILYRFSGKFALSDNAFILAKMSSNYRIPTFNSLYWRPGGNASLIPEKSHGQELRLIGNSTRWKTQLNLYSTLITNQIQWLPFGKGYFEAHQDQNKRRWNRGFEIDAEYSRQHWKSSLKASYTRSGGWLVNQKQDPNQQIYVPYWQVVHDLRYFSESWSIRLSNQYITQRFTDVLNKESLEPFWLVGLHGNIKLKSISIFGNINNILNESYEVLPFRPMPGLNFEAGLQWSLIANRQKQRIKKNI